MKNILFFGRDGCELSLKAHEYLVSLGFKVNAIYTNNNTNLNATDAFSWSGDYIFCFRSRIILTNNLINKARIAAINFHPGPPNYPGSGCINYALYDEAAEYGVTSHMMLEKIDSGDIIAYKKFPIHQADTVDSLLKTTHAELLSLFVDVVGEIYLNNASYIEKSILENKDIKWSGVRRKISDLDMLSVIDLNNSAAEVRKIIRATYTKNHPPKIYFHGYEFVLNGVKKITK